jgi:hypothetical protein
MIHYLIGRQMLRCSARCRLLPRSFAVLSTATNGQGRYRGSG